MLIAFGTSDPGGRTNNEDYFISDPEAGIFILADGMGGAAAGEHASRIGAERLYSYLTAHEKKAAALSLELGFLEANEAVLDSAAGSPELEGMGTTLLAAVASEGEGQWQICSVGDSRAYRCSNGQLTPITRDQTWAAEIGSRIGLSEQALSRHPMRHVLTMAIGVSRDLRVHSHVVDLRRGDQILLSSDGLHGVVGEETICQVLLSQKSLDDKCHYLVEAAIDGGGQDNITVVLAQAV